MHSLKCARRAIAGALFLSLNAGIALAQDPPVGFTFTTFDIPGAVSSLSVGYINDSGTISGNYTDSSGNTVAYTRTSGGTVTPYTEPADTTSPTFTNAEQINRAGRVVGEFYDTANATFEGYIYNSTAASFTTYQVPGQPQYTSTGLYGINNKGNLCGFVFPPPYTSSSAFVEVSGVVTIFTVNSASTNACDAINDSGDAVGYYTDSAGLFHGWLRTSTGTITTFEEPNASTVTGTAPCVSGAVGGTVPLGIDNAGYVSGHYWDPSNNEHGFLMTPGGKFYTLNVPGAYQTSGGGLNDKAVVVGHWDDSSCNAHGYIATP